MMEAILYMGFCVAMIVLCVKVGGNKGYSRVLFGVGGLFLGPLMLIIAAVLPNKYRMQEEAEARAAAKYRAAQSAAPAPKPAPAAKPEPKPQAAKTAEELNEEGMACEKEDPIKALGLFEQAGRMGNADAQYNAGLAYYVGRGVAVDYEKALDWFKEAATQGDAEAQVMCAKTLHEMARPYMFADRKKYDIYQEGVRHWYQKAAEQGHAEAQRMSGRLCYAKKEYAGARYWFEKAKAQGEDVEAFLQMIAERENESAAGNASD